jgi:hypothetical protein
MTIAFVLGNGLSRQHLNLAHLKNCGMIYGCNALYRSFTPDVLVATDKPIAEAIQASGYAKENRFYTRRPLPDSGALKLSDKYRGYSSGPNAVGLASADHHSSIYLLGFDMGPTADNLFNNIYANTEFYKTSQHPPTFTGNWVKQIREICGDFPKIKFFRVCGATTARINDLENIKNLQHLDLAIFLDRINNKKDL